ncbi:fasciclin domain-containing protein [Phenylobacterium sp.]|uniref:fasciclin domain-containing protein n=1 Tax=Phenylobacterium sp. TaxID=1871053 RepID=UPI002FDFBE1F
MTTYRLLTATAAAALIAGIAASGAAAQTPAAATAKTEAAAQAATGKASSDAAAATQPQGTAAAVKEGAAPVAAAQGAAPAAGAAKPVAVAGDLVDTLKASGQFGVFIQAVDSTNLTSLLKTNKNLTVFAPTDAAFAALPASELARLKADKAAMQKFVLHHIVNAPIPSSKIKGAKGPVATGAGDQVLLDGSDEAALKADGATIVQADLQTGSGLLQVVDRVLIAGQGDTSTAEASTGASTGASATAATPPDKQ